MSQLIKLREQIKTIKTIQKITQAMRLVSMSVHSRLNHQKTFLKNYQTELNKITNITNPNNLHFDQKIKSNNKKIIILIGSQKGLCGGFNADILRKYLSYHKDQPIEPFELLVIGKKLIDSTERKYLVNKKIIKFTPANLTEITNQIFNHIIVQNNFDKIVFFSNYSKSFFSHVTKISYLLEENLDHKNQNDDTKNPTEPYIWEQSAQELASKLKYSKLKLNIYCLLFDSLVAEYSARFRSMDNATRNAGNLLETAERQYRKLRQAKITRELVELSAIFQIK